MDPKIHTLITDLAGINLASANAEISHQAKDLIKQARVIRDGLGPIERSPESVKHHDDYLATQQLAVCIGYDGQLYTKQQTQCEEAYLIPLLAATQSMVNKLKNSIGTKLNMKPKEVEKWIKPIIDDIESEDFQRLWETSKPDLPVEQGGSRTKGAGQIIVPEKPRLQS